MPAKSLSLQSSTDLGHICEVSSGEEGVMRVSDMGRYGRHHRRCASHTRSADAPAFVRRDHAGCNGKTKTFRSQVKNNSASSDVQQDKICKTLMLLQLQSFREKHVKKPC